MPAIHGKVRWRLIDLCRSMWEEFRVSIAKPTLSREWPTLGIATSLRGRVITHRLKAP